MSPCIKSCCFILLVLTAAPFLGCQEPEPPSGDISGTVYFNDAPVGDCRIILFETTKKRWKGGMVDDEGKFELTKVPLGTYEISLGQEITNSPIKAPFDKRIPKKYRAGKTSGFTITVQEGDNPSDIKMAGK